MDVLRDHRTGTQQPGKQRSKQDIQVTMQRNRDYNFGTVPLILHYITKT
jgi:hypothetical protein